jgi:alpha-glucosidase
VLLFGVVAGFGQTDRPVYLPRGRWVDYHSFDWHDSTGAETPAVPVYRDRNGGQGLFTLPLFARAGAIIPLMYVDDKTRTVSGRREVDLASLTEEQRQRETRLTTELRVRVVAGESPTSFTLFEDDGLTLEYLDDHVRLTRIDQQPQADRVQVTIRAAQGDYHAAPAERGNFVELIVNDREAVAVEVNGLPLARLDSVARLDAGEVGWANAGRNRVMARGPVGDVGGDTTFVFRLSDPLPSRASLHFVCSNGRTQPGEAIFVSGNIPELGGWDPATAVLLVPVRYETWHRWSRTIDNLPPNTRIEWKFIKRHESGGPVLQWETAGPNHVSHTPASGFGGTLRGQFMD